jgi:hypothetical protein
MGRGKACQYQEFQLLGFITITGHISLWPFQKLFCLGPRSSVNVGSMLNDLLLAILRTLLVNSGCLMKSAYHFNIFGTTPGHDFKQRWNHQSPNLHLAHPRRNWKSQQQAGGGVQQQIANGGMIHYNGVQQ